ncbi:uncharacterized protein LOC125478737 [Pyrus x bretschneideri]|uniref:uncharacterized protein LOC125478737 n=1 Tax=Pyrus x bretschneideri TaxID=225117 RepID=UPI00202E3249|nr:uncharacterized protein LOC125478737 [Pyrus x bretschneideri]
MCWRSSSIASERKGEDEDDDHDDEELLIALTIANRIADSPEKIVKEFLQSRSNSSSDSLEAVFDLPLHTSRNQNPSIADEGTHEDDFFHVFLDLKKGTEPHITSTPNCRSSSRTSVWILALNVLSCTEGSQVSIVCRRNCMNKHKHQCRNQEKTISENQCSNPTHVRTNGN